MAVNFATLFQTFYPPGPNHLYVSTSGNDANPGTIALPKATIASAYTAMPSSGGIIHVSDGVYGESYLAGRNFSSWCLIMADNYLGAKINSVSTHGVMIRGSSRVGVFGFEVAGNGSFSCLWTGSQCHHIAFWRNWCHDGMVGIGAPGNQNWGDGFSAALNNIDICYNVVNDCAKDTVDPFGSSGVSIYNLWHVGIFPDSSPDDIYGYSNYIVGNIVSNNYQNCDCVDGNGIIIDDGNNTQSYGGPTGEVYTGHTLCLGNLTVHNGGRGVHAFQTNNVDEWFNTSGHNNFVKTNLAFFGELSQMFASGGSVYYNLVKVDTSTGRSDWFTEYLASYSSDGNVWLEGSNHVFGSIDRSWEGFNYFVSSSPTLAPTNLTLAAQWRPDGGSGIVERATLSVSDYNRYSRWPDAFGDYRPTNRAWAVGFTEPFSSTPAPPSMIVLL